MGNASASAVFRFDAGARIGGGHAMRCLTLAEAMIAAGWRCRFAIGPGTLETVHKLAAFDGMCIHLSGDPRTECDEMAQGLGGARQDFLVLDHYHRDAGFETDCRAFVERVVVIDDLADRPHDADILLDQNLGRAAADYDGLVAEQCRLLIGPQYALLRPQFHRLREAAIRQRQSRDRTERILVSFGMADPNGITLRTLRAIAKAGFAGHVDVVVGAGVPDMAAIQSEAARLGPNVRVLSNVEDMATLMADADLAVGAGGTTSWERCALGLPCLVVVVADNQAPIAQALSAAGAIRVIGDGATDEAALGTAIGQALTDRQGIAAMAEAAAGICDGSGCLRVVEALGHV